jgi:phage terminase large subunit
MTKNDPAGILASPSGFARAALGMDLYPKQAAVLDALAPAGSWVSFRSCNEGGKTKRVITAAILWHLSMFPRGQVISTSGSFRQIKDQLLPSLRAYGPRFPRWRFFETPRIETESVNCFWQGLSTNDAGKFEGYHAGPDAPLLIIVDEAKTVKNPIFEAVERCKPTRVLLASSPGYAEGEFYRSHTTRAQFYKTFKQRADECPHITKEEIAKIRAKWRGTPLEASMLDAEFMEFVANAIVDLKALEDLMAEPPEREAGDRHAFCDFAWGGDGDENVLALRDGNLVTLPLTFLAGDLHSICGRFVSQFVKLGLKPEEISGDEGGGGKLVIDQLHAMGWPIGRVNNGAAPRFDDHYANAGAEMWFEGAKKIVRREVILPDDNEMKAQMLNRKKIPHIKGKLAIEHKKDMKKGNREGGPASSPDRADAVFGSLMPPLQLRSFATGPGSARTFGEQLSEYNALHSDDSDLPGAYCP